MGKPDDQLYLCLDQGGHASRAVIVDHRGAIHGTAKVAIATRREGCRVEHDAAELVQSLQQSARQAVSTLDAGQRVRLSAAGLATQRSSVVCWDRTTGEPLSPVLSWQDTRAADWLVAFQPYQQRIHRLTGLVLSPHYGVSKLHWCLQQVPAVRAAAAAGTLCMGPLAAWLAARLTGKLPAMADPANASRTLLWDADRGGWSEELLQLFGLPASVLPIATTTRTDWGQLGHGLDIPLTVVTGDQSAAVFAFGAPAASTAYTNLGTGAFVQRVGVRADRLSEQLLRSVLYQDAKLLLTAVEGTVNGAGSAIAWAADRLGIAMETVHAEAGSWLSRSGDLPVFINTVGGLGSPWWQSGMEPRLPSGTDVPDTMAAVYESIVFLLLVNLELLDRGCGRAERLVVTGGLGSVDPLLQRLADLAARPVLRSDVREGTALGLAWLVAGMPDNWPQLRAQKVFTPVADSALHQRFMRWREAMPALPHAT